MQIVEHYINIYNLTQIIHKSVSLLQKQIEEEKRQKLVDFKEFEKIREDIINKFKKNKLYKCEKFKLEIDKEHLSILLNFFLFYIEGMDIANNENLKKLKDFVEKIIKKYSLQEKKD